VGDAELEGGHPVAGDGAHEVPPVTTSRLTPSPAASFPRCHRASVAENERTCEFLPLVGLGPQEEDRSMFTVDCPTHGTEVLLSERRIEAVTPVPAHPRGEHAVEGQLLRWRCWCDTEGTTFIPRMPAMVGRYRLAV
jgi:hypothetical protein